MNRNHLSEFFVSVPKNAPVPDADTLKMFTTLVDGAKTPELALQNYNLILPYLNQYKGQKSVLIAAAYLLEYQRLQSGLFDTWQALHMRYMSDGDALRMRLRWLRRMRSADDGTRLIYQSLPDLETNIEQAFSAMLAYVEVNAFDEIDLSMSLILPKYPDDSWLRIRYAKHLAKFHRYIEAKKQVDSIKNRAALSDYPKSVIASINEKAKFQAKHDLDDVVGLLGKLVSRFTNRTPRPRSKNSVGGVVFLTAHLGAGGAERQLTRISAAMETARVKYGEYNGLNLSAPIRVTVRHANPSTGRDFFFPVLKRANVDTYILADHKIPDIAELELDDPDLENLLGFLPQDVLDATLQLVPYFKKNNIEVAYLWQDGGILIAALAALLAGVPRIITSFRGQPPNLRRDLFRPQLPGLYTELAKVPGVDFTSNSKAAMDEYLDWLDISPEKCRVIYNALVPASTQGDDEDRRKWQNIKEKSAACTKTVVGIFRYDVHKRPQFWVRVAAEYAKANPDTRFIVVGDGNEMGASEAIISELGIADRVFLVGRSFHVGYWLEKSDAMLHLSYYEGLPNAVIEAQIAGIPVVVAPAGGTVEAMIHGETGFCLAEVKSDNANEIIAYLDQILKDPAKAADMGQKAKAFAAQRFSPERVIEQTLRMFLEA